MSVDDETETGEFEGECALVIDGTVWLNGAARFVLTKNGVRGSTAWGSTPFVELKTGPKGAVAIIAFDWQEIAEIRVSRLNTKGRRTRKNRYLTILGTDGHSELMVQTRAWELAGSRQTRISDASPLFDYFVRNVLQSKNMSISDADKEVSTDTTSIRF